ncbi:hypothetical protein Trco_008001, partial [Trichoderma cornu-damae]
TVEDFPQGYPRFSALVASHHSFQLCRRFSALRARLLLLKQDRLSLLEKELESVDSNEVTHLALGSCRRDNNRERRAILENIDSALADYDSFLERHQKALGFEAASRRPVSNLRNWLDGKACVARAETAYLEVEEDLVSISPSQDNIVTWLENLAERARISLTKRFAKGRRPPGVSRDPGVHVFPPSSTKRAVHVLLAPSVAVLLLAPVIAFNFIDSLAARLAIVILTTTGFVFALSCLTRARVVDLIVAGA